MRSPVLKVSAAIAIAAVGLTVGGCQVTGSGEAEPVASPTVGDLTKFYSQPMTWKRCEGEFMCATYQVPLDYADTSGKTISIRVLKSAAKSASNRIGALVLNPGGPGGSGYDHALYSSASFSQELVDRYDIVGFDPRGVGKSTPIECLSDAQTDQVTSNLGAPSDAKGAQAATQAAALIGQTCTQRSPELTPHIGTVDTVRDLDILRSLLGESKLNFLGQSYGTFIGLTYAEMFTGNVGRFVLDGVIDPALDNAGLARGQAEGFQLALGKFIDDCIKRPTCPLPRTNANVARARIDSWLAKLGVTPIRAYPGRPLTRPLAVNGIVASLYDDELGWSELANALRAGFAGDGGPMMDIADSFLGREPSGKYFDNSFDALYAVNCLDRPDRADPVQTAQLASEWSKTAPTFGSELAWSNLPCYDWPAPATDSPHAISADGAPEILLIGTLSDPATPYPWAVAVHEQLASSSLVTVDINGHTAVNRNACVDAIVDDALVRGQMPPADTRC